MNTVRITSGDVVCILGTKTTDANGTPTFTGVNANTTGDTQYKASPTSAFQAVVQGTGAVTATVNIYGSNDGTFWNSTALGTITLSGTTSHADGFAGVAPYKYIRAVLSNLTGTGATCYVTMGS